MSRRRIAVAGLAWAGLVLGVVAGSVVLVLVTVGRGSNADHTRAAPSRPPPALADEVRESAVLVGATGCRIEARGMGVAVDPGLVVTNAHVVAGASEVTVTTTDDVDHRAEIVAWDPLRDIAVLEAPTLDVPTLGLAPPESGTHTFVLARGGEPGDDPVIEVLDSSVVRTINIFISDIYGDGRHERRGLEVAVDIGPGDSGGGVIDPAGAVVGIVFSSSRGKEDVAYAISAVEVEMLVAGRAAAPVDSGRCRQ